MAPGCGVLCLMDEGEREQLELEGWKWLVSVDNIGDVLEVVTLDFIPGGVLTKIPGGVLTRIRFGG